ncbi:MAG: Gfo/Idh/MocA family oxidoreductase [Actinobacteria bacterium]|nr:Gfo/Idh/MocA family oxidoreductase [Actinomycetota bacterium]
MEKSFRVAVCGCGNIADTWISYVIARKDVEIVALVDIVPENSRAMLKKYVLSCKTYNSLSGAIKASGANLVFDLTVPSAHKETVITGLELGCDVLGEKPMANTLEEARIMVDAAVKCRRYYSVMQNYRFNKYIRALKDLVKTGTIGPAGFICADYFYGDHFGGFRQVMDNPLILDVCIHTFDQARFILESDPVSVYCYEFNPIGSWYKGNAAVVCIFEFSNGEVFCYRGSRVAEGALTSWHSSWRIMGTMGTAIWDGKEAPYCEVVLPGRAENKLVNDFKRIDAELKWIGKEWHQGALDEMFSSLIEGKKSENDCTDNIKSVSMMVGAVRSALYSEKIFLKDL